MHVKGIIEILQKYLRKWQVHKNIKKSLVSSIIIVITIIVIITSSSRPSKTILKAKGNFINWAGNFECRLCSQMTQYELCIYGHKLKAQCLQLDNPGHMISSNKTCTSSMWNIYHNTKLAAHPRSYNWYAVFLKQRWMTPRHWCEQTE